VSTEFYWVAVAIVTIISAARLTRLATVDKFPPVKAVRNWYEDKTDGSDWQWLTLCGYCFSFWETLIIVTWGLLAGVYAPPERGDMYDDIAFSVWWIFNATFAASYAAAVFMARDGSTGEDD
jgi:hypothetical protein